MKIDAQKVRELREMTGVSVLKCQEALKKSGGDLEKAILELRKQGETSAAKKLDREVKEGLVCSYVHANGKIGVLVKLYCETDFVSRNEEFKELGKDLAMQIAAANPLYLKKEDIPEKVLEKEKEVEREALRKEKKPGEVVEKIIEGKLEKFSKENTLLGQSYIKNPEITVEDLLKEKINKLGENIKIGEFVRYEI